MFMRRITTNTIKKLYGKTTITLTLLAWAARAAPCADEGLQWQMLH